MAYNTYRPHIKLFPDLINFYNIVRLKGCDFSLRSLLHNNFTNYLFSSIIFTLNVGFGIFKIPA